jgi:hypothetical protein
MMREEPDQVRAVAPQHVAYWRGLDARGYIGGPFADRSGGLITLEVDSNEEAERLIAADPFVQQDLLEVSWMKEGFTDQLIVSQSSRVRVSVVS